MPTDIRTIKRPSSPNTYLMAPDGYCENAEPDAGSPLFDVSAEVLFGAVLEHIEEQSNWTIAETDRNHCHVDLVAATKLLKFKDDVTIDTLVAENMPGKSRMAIYSRSRVGYHDLGANKKRVNKLVQAIEDKLGNSA
ncbi:DUF1499 domain-containing protein [Henriciella sp. AS95]|uniref:DUF1499 domain-containing protein n=1 Tax=Henriciella sp. AS95 TaxID=3135782 RepID=UPI00317F0E5C